MPLRYICSFGKWRLNSILSHHTLCWFVFFDVPSLVDLEPSLWFINILTCEDVNLPIRLTSKFADSQCFRFFIVLELDEEARSSKTVAKIVKSLPCRKNINVHRSLRRWISNRDQICVIKTHKLPSLFCTINVRNELTNIYRHGWFLAGVSRLFHNYWNIKVSLSITVLHPRYGHAS